MSRIAGAFKNKKAFIAFIAGGDPDIETTEKLIIEMAEAGVDLIEIGVPFSDPVAEGPVIQEADERALLAGCTVVRLFDMIKRVRSKVEIPLLFMSYMNPIFVYGKEKFMQKCAECGLDGVIVPDLPFEEKGELSGVCEKYNIALISLIAPTSGERIETIAKESEGFIYCVSSPGVTGVRDEINTNITEMIERVRSVSDTPCAIGFGISTPEQARIMADISDGVIIGSAIVQIIAEYGRNCIEPVKKYISDIKEVLMLLSI
ncbi:MAG: tryptophan synthase subunit alpha [Oscillospiraceae bacterium]|jgi:tryptophan synthase alpha chain|nr:tryptophan synthase subunit alpha [Oscillospiraceae bacterium]